MVYVFGRVIAGISGVWNAVPIREAWGSDYGAAESTQMLVVDMEKISNRMDENEKIAGVLQQGTAIFTKF